MTDVEAFKNIVYWKNSNGAINMELFLDNEMHNVAVLRTVGKLENIITWLVFLRVVVKVWIDVEHWLEFHFLSIIGIVEEPAPL
jgi:hypothetical protein